MKKWKKTKEMIVEEQLEDVNSRFAIPILRRLVDHEEWETF